MIKKMRFVNPNQMYINSGYKQFDRYTQIITKGNVWADNMYSSFVRPWNETECNGKKYEPGYLTSYDMRNFGNLTQTIIDCVYDKSRKESVILYQFYVIYGRTRTIIGHVLTDYDYNYIAHNVVVPYGSQKKKREQAIMACIPYICHDTSLPKELLEVVSYDD